MFTKRNKIIFVSIAIVIFVVILSSSNNGGEEVNLVKVIRGNVVQEVSETGQLKKGEKIDLSFSNSGRIEKIYVSVGQDVKKGDALMKLETRELEIQLLEAKASLAISQAKLDKLVAGASIQEIQKKQTVLSNAEISLKNAEQNLVNIENQTNESLKAAYDDSLNVIDSGYLYAYNAKNFIDLLQRSYFPKNDQEGLKVKENKNEINNALLEMEVLITAAESKESEDIDLALIGMQTNLSVVYDSLGDIRDICEELTYRNVVSTADKTSLDTHKLNINTALTNIVNSQQTLASTKLSNEVSINTAQTSVSTAQGVLKIAQDDLSLITSDPRKEDLALYEAQVSQAQSSVSLLQDKINKAILRSYADAQVAEINKEIGEMAQQDVVVSLLPSDLFDIEVDIYEEDVVKMNIGNPVDISLIVFPDEIFKGIIISIDPAEEIVNGVVYYKVRIGFDEIPENVKPGMTADLIIKTSIKEDVLIVPEDALEKSSQGFTVNVFKNGNIQEREVETGITGVDGMVEIISGLEENEEIVLE